MKPFTFCCIGSIHILFLLGCNESQSIKNNTQNSQESLKLIFDCSSEIGGVPVNVEELISSGANVNTSNIVGDTPLHLACQRGNFDVANVLINNGANVDAQNNKGETPIYIICRASAVDLIEQTTFGKGAKAYVPVEFSGQEEFQQFCEKFKSYHMRFINLLIKAGADVNISDKNGWTPLHKVSYDHSLYIMEMLLQNGARTDTVQFLGYTPLHIACYNGQIKATKLLVENGAEVNAVNEYKVTPLWKAAENGDVEVVKCLLDNGADKNIAARKGLGIAKYTPADIAKKLGNVDAYRLINNY